MAWNLEHAIAKLAARQRGFVTRQQLLALGLTDQAIRYRIRLKRLIPVYAGIYAVGHVPVAPIDRAAGALLACGAGAALSHSSAYTLWGLDKVWRMPFEVTAPTRRRHSGIRTHCCELLRRADFSVQLGVRVTGLPRTLLDVAPRLSDRALKRAVNEARIRRHMRLLLLAEMVERFPRHPGAARLRPFISRGGAPTRSEFEDAFLEFADLFGLPQPLLNTHVCGYEVDAFFPQERLAVELDGYEFHRTRESFEGDRDRDANLLLAGIATVRVTWARMTTMPQNEATRLGAILDARRA